VSSAGSFVREHHSSPANSVDNDLIRQGHVDDIFVPVDPDTLGLRLTAAGFTDVTIEPGEYQIRFSVTKP
jgi:hypothetical protein